MTAAPRANGGPHSSPTGLAPEQEARQHFSDRRRTISSNPETTGRSDLPSSLNPRWKSSWAAIRTFSSKHRALTAVLGAIALGLISGACRVLGENFTEQILTWIIQR
ncbi:MULTISPECIES: hypothetical protein [unclassified Streptomyces]|uniref:hypothetical protein n=1 Tax=unclassified Streptomyces TaxID=2593676 RepID=UPI0009D4EEA9|nr:MULTISPECIES: hypothetical protein [unclassified Streptomyces]ONI50940.1 hypothetical protein STIB_47400 [Streptomyces sp. IB2014 011-1]